MIYLHITIGCQWVSLGVGVVDVSWLPLVCWSLSGGTAKGFGRKNGCWAPLLGWFWITLQSIFQAEWYNHPLAKSAKWYDVAQAIVAKLIWTMEQTSCYSCAGNSLARASVSISYIQVASHGINLQKPEQTYHWSVIGTTSGKIL